MDGSVGMAQGDQSGMPTAPNDAMTVDQGVPGGAPSPSDMPPVDVNALDADIRQFLEGHFRQGYVPASDLDGLRSTKDREVETLRQEVQRLALASETGRAQSQAAVQAFSQYLQEVLAGTRQPHANDIATFTLALQNSGQRVQHDRVTAHQEFVAWQAKQDQGFEAELSLVAQGNPQAGIPALASVDVIRNDAQVTALRAELLRIGQEDAASRFQRPELSQRGAQVTEQLRRRIYDLAQSARLQQAVAPIQQTGQLVQQNLARQAERGVQTPTLTGASAGGGLDDDGLWNAAKTRIAQQTGVPLTEVEGRHYQDIYREYSWMGRQQNASR